MMLQTMTMATTVATTTRTLIGNQHLYAGVCEINARNKNQPLAGPSPRTPRVQCCSVWRRSALGDFGRLFRSLLQQASRANIESGGCGGVREQ